MEAANGPLPPGAMDNNGPIILAVNWSLFSVAFIVVALRSWIRLGYLKERPASHDILMFFALLTSLLNGVFVSISTHYGVGRHIYTLEPRNIELAAMWNYVDFPFLLLPSMFGRISFAYFLLGLIGPSSRGQRLSLHVINVYQVVSTIVVVVQTYTQCGSHIEALWDHTLPRDLCISPNVEIYIGYVTSSLNAVSDLWLTLLPLILTMKLNMAKSTRRALAAVLCLSSVAFVASVCRIGFLTFLVRPDYTWYIAFLTFCVVIESNIVIITASMPTLRPLWKKSGIIHSARNGYSLESYQDNDGSRTSATGHSAPSMLTSDVQRSRSVGKAGFAQASDDASEEYILSPTGTSVSGPGSALGYGNKQDINKTTQLSVNYNARGTEETDEESDVGFSRPANQRSVPQRSELYGTQLRPYSGQPQGMYPPHVLREQQEKPSELPNTWKQ